MTGDGMEWTDSAIAARAKEDPAFRDGLLAAAAICRAQDRDLGAPPCPSTMAAVYIENAASGDSAWKTRASCELGTVTVNYLRRAREEQG